jgi:hypothetical protein
VVGVVGEGTTGGRVVAVADGLVGGGRIGAVAGWDEPLDGMPDGTAVGDEVGVTEFDGATG